MYIDRRIILVEKTKGLKPMKITRGMMMRTKADEF